MSEIKNINGYKLQGPLSSRGAGFSKWGVAMKNGRRFFIKEFLSPVYPLDTKNLSEKIIQSKREICENFYREKSALYQRLNECKSGNIVWVEDFFRYGSKYYIIEEFLEPAGDSVQTVSTASEPMKRMILRLLAYNISVLHGAGIVHSDIKPDNILIKPTKTGCYTAKLIDFDCSFFVDSPPEAGDDIHGDFVYLAPEAFIRMRDEEGEITEKSDIFSLGVMFHELWCGRLPYIFENDNYVFETVLNGQKAGLHPSIPLDIQKLLWRMLLSDPTQRPSARECFCILGGHEHRDVPPSPPKRPLSLADNTSVSEAKVRMHPAFKQAGDL